VGLRTHAGSLLQPIHCCDSVIVSPLRLVRNVP
jgi:hypothetical protein